MPALFCCASPETSLDFLSATSVGELASSPFTTGLPPSSLSPATVSALSAPATLAAGSLALAILFPASFCPPGAPRS